MFHFCCQCYEYVQFSTIVCSSDFILRLCSTVPSAPVLDSTLTVTTDTITISGSVPSGSEVTGYVVQWQRDTSHVCPDLSDDGSITVTSSSFTGHTITGLEPGNRYTITVTASNGAGSGPVSNAVTAMTTATGKALYNPQIPYNMVGVTLHSSQWCSWSNHSSYSHTKQCHCPVGRVALSPEKWRDHRLHNYCNQLGWNGGRNC